MGDWYYHDAARGRVGPLSAEQLRQLYRDRRVQHDTLLWREGLAEWQPLDRLSAELGLDAVVPDPSQPPPLPPGHAHAAATRDPMVPRAPAAAPRQGMSGCLIALIVAGVLAVPVIGILAAIAIPAYNDYTVRAKTSQAIFDQADGLKTAIGEYWLEQGSCPANGEGGFGEPADYVSATLAGIQIGSLDNGHCAFEMEFQNIGSLVDGETVLFEAVPDDHLIDWNCHGGSLPARYRPAQCRPERRP
jgi:type IV pilus assembly protein PilA